MRGDHGPALKGNGSRRDALVGFLQGETAGGVVLLAAVVVAMVWANLLSGAGYFSFWSGDLTIGIGSLSITDSLQHWVTDGLMAIFFFVVGLEIKRELTVGELNERRKAALPVIAACGGVILPALIFTLVNLGGPYLDGWAIPMATDVAFAVALLALLGRRIPSGARLFLLAIAIVDDLIAITVIAVFYTETINFGWLAFAAAGLLLALLMRRFGAISPLWYLPVGLLVWIGFFESGVHATIAGVSLGLITPAGPVGGRRVLEELEKMLHPWSSLVVVPVFALANAGVAFNRQILDDAIGSTLFAGIALGLVFGKLLGIAAASFGSVRFGLAALPEGVGRRHVWGVAALGGIGFTVSIFIAGLSFADIETVEIAKLGVFAGSLISAGLGSLILLRGRPRHRCPRERG